MSDFGLGFGVGFVVGAAVAAGGVWLWKSRPNSAGSASSTAPADGGSLLAAMVGTSVEPGDPAPASAPVDETEELRQSLRLKCLYDDEKVARLIDFELSQMPAASEADWIRAAIRRWEEDNR